MENFQMEVFYLVENPLDFFLFTISASDGLVLVKVSCPTNVECQSALTIVADVSNKVVCITSSPLSNLLCHNRSRANTFSQ